MKRLVSYLIVLILILASCDKGDFNEDKEFNGMAALKHNSYVILDSKFTPTGVPELTIAKNGVVQEESLARLFCKESSFDLIAGQSIFTGHVIISNDHENLYVTYQSEDGWKIKEIHLYVGSSTNVPVNSHNVPVPGQFPIKESFDPPVETVTYEIPLEGLPDCLYVLAHAVVVKCDKEETAWGKGGLSFEKAYDISRWGWVIEFCPDKCDEEIIIGMKSYVVDPKVYDAQTDKHLWWVVTKGEGSTSNCLSLGFNSFDVEQTSSSVYDLIKWGDLNDKRGFMTVFTTTENEVKYLNIVIDLDDDNLAFSHTYLYVGSPDGIQTYYYVYDKKDCYKFYQWFFQDHDILNTKTFKIALTDIDEK